MDWDDIRLVFEIARTGSFSAAAEAMQTSKPTISRRIAALEQRAQVQIFRRTPYGASLSADGEKLLKIAAQVEQGVVEFEKVFSNLGQSRREIRVASSEGVASYLLMPVIANQELGPLGSAAKRLALNLSQIRLVPSHAPNCDIKLRWLGTGQLPDGKATDRVVRLANIAFVPFCSKSPAGAIDALPDCFDKLAERHRLITHDAYRAFDDGGWREWHRLTEQGALFTSWTSAVGHLTLNGAGIGLLPAYATHYAAGFQKIDEFAIPKMTANLWMVCEEETYQEPAVMRSFSALRRLFAEASWGASV